MGFNNSYRSLCSSTLYLQTLCRTDDSRPFFLWRSGSGHNNVILIVWYDNLQVEDLTFHVFLADFGLGKVLNNCMRGRTTMQAGTPAFQPPEQLKHEACGVESDVYAFACILLEIFGEKPVWEGLPPHTIILRVAGGTYPSVDHLPARVADVVQMCFVPKQQRANAAMVLKALCRLLPS